MVRTNWDKLVTAVIENNGGRRASTAGIGLDFKTVWYYVVNADGSETGAYSVSGVNYKECYNSLCEKLQRWGKIGI